MYRSTLLIDASVVHPIGALPPAEQEQLWNELLTRFAVVIPWVLIEEVWTNFARPGKKPANVVQGMVERLKLLQAHWIDEEPNLIFDELVIQQKTPERLKAPDEKIMGYLLRLPSKHSGSAQFFANRKKLIEADVQNRIADQQRLEQELRSRGLSTTVESRKEFIQGVVADSFTSILDDPACRLPRLNSFFGEVLTRRRPSDAERIQSAFQSFNRDTYVRFQVTTACLLARLTYLYAPVFRINNGSRDGEAILGRGKSAQRGNLQDERYVACALMCGGIITRDAAMASMIRCFSEARLWVGRLIYLEPQRDIRTQIPGLL